MNREQLEKSLRANGVDFPDGMSVTELKALQKVAMQKLGQGESGSGVRTNSLRRNPMAGLEGMRKQTLQKILIDLGGVPMEGYTKGDLLLHIRSEIEHRSAQLVNFGKYGKIEGWTFDDVVKRDQKYTLWSMGEASHESTPELRILAMLGKLWYHGHLPREEKAEKPVVTHFDYIPRTSVKLEQLPKKEMTKEELNYERMKNEVKQELLQEMAKGQPKPKMKTSRGVSSGSGLQSAPMFAGTEQFKMSSEDDLSDTPPSVSLSESQTSWMEIGEKRRK